MLLPGQTLSLTIDRLSRQGEGVAQADGLPVFVPFALPGEQVNARITQTSPRYAQAQVVETLHASPERQTPPCVHFTRCGGCQLQHLPGVMYRALKEDMLRSAIMRAGYDESALRPLVDVGPASRRRVELAVRVRKGEVSLGFHEARSHGVIPLAMCPVMEPALFALVSRLQEALNGLKKPSVITSLALTLADNGIDAETTLAAPLKEADRARLAQLSAEPALLRLTMLLPDGERMTLFEKTAPVIALGSASVELPPGAFLQASRAGQAALTDAVLRHLSVARRIVDLYAGCGTYSLPLATQGHAVHAFEGHPDMVTALHNAARREGWENRVSAHVRDLFRQPLSSRELQSFDGAVINPPRNGALPQTEALAQGRITRIVMVSCNPATFARDAAALHAAGYLLEEAIPVDQFHWSTHLELVAAFRR
jgi:23S rRNA (uracil1939-C5)-methyltransferase